MEQAKKRRRGGDVKRAPVGFYTARQAQLRLGMTKQTFYRQVDAGAITRVQLKLSGDGYYPQEEIDTLAEERTLALLEHLVEKRMEPAEFRVATKEDVSGIKRVLDDLGWKGPTEEQRQNWYNVNDQIDYVVTQNEVIMGFVSLTPYHEDILEARMSGHRGSAQIEASNILPFEPGKVYDVFVGIATRDVPHRTRYTKRLVFGVFGARGVLEKWVRQGILIHRMYGVSDQPNGQELGDILGFDQLPAKDGDAYPRYMLDMETSDNLFARQYRDVIRKVKE